MNSHEKPSRIPGELLAGLLLVLMAVLAGGAALRESVTVDEVAHIGAGVSYLQKLDLRMNPEHPPLAKVLAALPLVCRGVRADYGHISWTASDKFLPAFLGQWVFGDWLLERWNDPKSVLAWARLPMLLLTLALGCAVYLYARRLGGEWGGLLCLSVYVSTPAFLTFGPLVHTDLAVTLFSLLALWTFAEIWQQPNRKNVALFGLSLAGALLSKFSSGILFFAFVVFLLSLRWRAVPVQPRSQLELRQWRRVRRRATLKGVLYAAVAVYAFYFVFSWHQSTGALERFGTGPAALFLRRLLMPALLYFGGVLWVVLTGRRGTFLLGHAYSHGIWFYFPVVFALKSSLGFLALLLLAATVGISRKVRDGTSVAVIPTQFTLHWRVLWVSLLVFTGACLLSPLDISIRHFSVPLVLLVMLLAPLPRMLANVQRRSVALAGTATAAALAVSCLFTALHAYPYYLPYVNALSFGRPTYALLNDSNVDWNQGLPEVKRFAEQNGLQEIPLDQYGFSDVTTFVPQAYPWNCQTPTQEVAGKLVTLSAANFLEARNCAWLLQYPREALAGGSIYVVRLPAQIPAVGSAGGPPLPSAYRTFGGVPFETRGLFSHLIQNPDDLPRAVEWMQTAFSDPGKSQGPPPKFPWER
jgi:4-amino-4-deoxy-L-arabinose transferase-like glycosyltransferase